MKDYNSMKTSQTMHGIQKSVPKEGLLLDNWKNKNVEYQGQFLDEVSLCSSRLSMFHEENMVD